MFDTLNYFCRLCFSRDKFSHIKGMDERKFYICQNCKLISAHPDHYLNSKEEKDRYLTHNNGIQYEGYVNFLMQAITPALPYLKKEMTGLDYGCGHTPTLSHILKRHGFVCEDYDPFFIKNELNKKYGFIFSTEVFEHFFNPADELKRISQLIEENGLLIIMTELWKSSEHFNNWYYTRDPSHVAFYCKETFDFICNNFGFTKIYDDDNRVVILNKL